MTTSLLLTTTPLDSEPLPLYSRDDPDSISIRSAAPSYVSDTPTYCSHRTPVSLLPPLSPTSSSQSSARGLPAVRYAPGFQNRDPHATRALAVDVDAWRSTRSSNNARQYSAVARRRANQAQANTTAILNSLSAVPPPLERSSVSSSAASASSSTTHIDSYPVAVGSASEPLLPLEDPYLVGEEAAGRARAQRVYREMCLRGEETTRYENRSWEFMLGQMSDWDDRQRSWTQYRRKSTRQSKLLGRMLGLGLRA